MQTLTNHVQRFLTSWFSGVLLLVLSVSFSNLTLANTQVGLYEVFETHVINSKTYSNPFNFSEIELQATFTAPSGNQIAFFGFYDGNGTGGQTGNVWKLRFMPNELGTWNYSYSWTDGTPGNSGKFDVISSNNKGILKIDPLYPHYLIYTNGERFFWNGDTEWFFLSDAFTQAARFAAIDFLATKKVNNLLMVMVNDDTYQVHPWISTSNRTRFDLSRMQKWEGVVNYMRTKGIIADLWFYSDDSPSLYPAAGSAEEILYFKYIIARFAAYSNVTWNLALEFQEYRSFSWATSQAQFVKNTDPFKHLVSVHQLDGSGYVFPGNPHIDHTSIQMLGFDHAAIHKSILDNRAATAAAGRPIPIMNEEFFIEGAFGDLTQHRQAIWAITTAGGYYKSASLGWWIGTPYQSGQHFNDAMRLYDFITKVPYWEMIPSDNLVNSGYALAKSGKRYVIYLPLGGPVSVNLSSASGPLSVEWYNPRTGTYTAAGSTTGGASRNFTAPDSKDWVLHIKSGSAGTVPSAPTGIVVK